MIEVDLQKAILALYRQGLEIRTIARRLGVSRNSVRAIIANNGEIQQHPRQDTIFVCPDLLKSLYGECNGWKERIWEKLEAEHHIKIGYSTLTRKIRELDLGRKPRAAKVQDQPGVEMQQDTSPYTLKIGTIQMRVIGCSLYFRYSKKRFLQFYRTFTRFKMKCFFYEAFKEIKYAAPTCIVDNTNLVVDYGTGPNAVMHAEMVAFARRYGFTFVAHRIGHSDRKAGEERSFWTVETNFFPGRTFSSLEDLNAQARHWSTVTIDNRPMTKAKIIPSQAIEEEKPFLCKIPQGLPAPYLSHDRGIDQYGFVAFDTNHYWC